MIINHNLTALSAMNATKVTDDMLRKSIRPLATGLRMNTAADDASGIAISERMRAQIAGYTMAIKNAQDGISLLQTAEGALGDADGILQRMRELSVQGANDTYTLEDRAHIQEELEGLKDKLNVIAEHTEFNKKKLLDGSAGLLWSGSDDTLRAIVHGGAFSLDRPEGSYRIEVRANPGKAQIYTSNQFKVFTVDSNDEVQVNTLSGLEITDIAQTLTLIQGDGKTAKVTLYSEDTLFDAAEKLNDAISAGLGQGTYTEDASSFCILSDGALIPVDGGYELSAGLIIQSALPGRGGEIYFSGNDDVMKALGLNEIQASGESEYIVSVYDAHSGEALASDVKITGSTLHDVIAANIDVRFSPMAGTSAVWNEDAGQYVLTGTGTYTGTLDLTNSGIIFQIGTNQAENFAVQFGDVSSIGLGLEGVSVMTRELASRSIGLIDEAIDTVVKNRTQIVSYTSSLEHSTANLAESGANLTNARGRLTDADAAKSTVRFIEFQILSHAQNAVLAQANQQPEAVYSLLNRE